jgi:hypothetical protein
MSERKNNRAALTLMDATLLVSPLFILLFVLLLEGLPGADILKKPEWSFVSVFLVIESFRDAGPVWRRHGEGETQIEAGLTFMAVFLVLTALVLAIDFRHSLGRPTLPTDAVYALKFFWFLLCFLVFITTRFRRHAS